MRLSIIICFHLSILWAAGASGGAAAVGRLDATADSKESAARIDMVWTATDGRSTMAIDAALGGGGSIYVLVSVYDASACGLSGNEQLDIGSNEGFRVIRVDPNGATEALIDLRGPLHASAMCYDELHSKIYVTGGFSTGCLDFDPGGSEDTHVGLAQENLFLSCFHLDGGYQWTNSWNGSYGCDVVVDENGFVYVVGEYGWEALEEHTGMLTPVPTGLQIRGENRALVSRGGLDGFLVRLSPLAEALWVRTWGGPCDERVTAAVITGEGDVVVLGHTEAPYPWSSMPIESGCRLCDVVRVSSFNPDGRPCLGAMFEGESVTLVSGPCGVSQCAFGMSRQPYQVFQVTQHGLLALYYCDATRLELTAMAVLDDSRVVVGGRRSFENESEEALSSPTAHYVKPGQTFCGYLGYGGSIEVVALVDEDTAFYTINGIVPGQNEAFVFGDIWQMPDGSPRAFVGRTLL